MSNISARKRSRPSLSRKGSDVGSADTKPNTPSDEKQREAKSADYKDQRYETLLSTKGSFMDVSRLGITSESKTMCEELVRGAQDGPRDSLFRDDLFESTMRKMRTRNETLVIRDVSLHIVPSAEILATYGADSLERLID